MPLSVVVPFHRDLSCLERCLEALALSTMTHETIVVADQAPQDPVGVATRFGATVLAIEGPQGPAAARNRGADIAQGDILVFVDSDVVVHKDALAVLASVLESDATVDAVFGAYDTAPADPGFVSQCKNLSHAYIHQRGQREAITFWAGLGAVRTLAFRRVGGFDERFRRPSVEDIDLGYRLTRAGSGIRLEPKAQGTHLKRWTWWSALKTDVLDRGIPWTQLLHRYGSMRNDLNLTWKYRVSVALAYMSLFASVASVRAPWLLAVAAAGLGIVAWLDRDYYGFLARQRGGSFALRWFPLHVLHHLGNGVSFVVGSALRVIAPWAPPRTPGALPSDPWTRPDAMPGARSGELARPAAATREPPGVGS